MPGLLSYERVALRYGFPMSAKGSAAVIVTVNRSPAWSGVSLAIATGR